MSEMYVDNKNARFVYGTKPIGFIQLYPNVHLSMTEKPCWFHLLMTRLLLGWKWIDADESGQEVMTNDIESYWWCHHCGTDMRKE